MKIALLNQHFDGRRLLPRDTYEKLIGYHRVFKTEAHFTRSQAERFLPPTTASEAAEMKNLLLEAGHSPEAIERIYTPGGRYFGRIFTETATWEEAQQIAVQRQMGEVVVARLEQVTQLQEDIDDLVARLPEGQRASKAEQQFVAAVHSFNATLKEALRAAWYAAHRQVWGFEFEPTAVEAGEFEAWYQQQYPAPQIETNA